MRCPTCGTENVPDSRFCGACGAKLTPESRVAPTEKISDDAPFPAHYGSQAPYTPPPYQSIPYQTGPASIPPQNYQSGPASIPPRPASIPPGAYPAPQTPKSIPPTNARMYGRAQSPAARDPSMSMPVVARPRWGLIILVLLLDVGLAAAGAIMLQKGLAKPEATEAPPPVSAPGSAAPPKAAVQPTPSPTVAANIAAIAEKVPDPDPKPPDDKASDKASVAKPAATKKPPATKPGPTPEDPYDNDKGLRAEIELAAARSKDDFNKCRDDAGDVHGRIDIGFTVETDGRIDRVKVASNTTESQTLASCLQTAVSHWAFATRPSQASDFVRPFIY
jgi:hypothetical protein